MELKRPELWLIFYGAYIIEDAIKICWQALNNMSKVALPKEQEASIAKMVRLTFTQRSTELIHWNRWKEWIVLSNSWKLFFCARPPNKFFSKQAKVCCCSALICSFIKIYKCIYSQSRLMKLACAALKIWIIPTLLEFGTDLYRHTLDSDIRGGNSML